MTSYGSRPPAPYPAYGRPPYPSQSPVFPAPQGNGGMIHGAPLNASPSTSRFGESFDQFDSSRSVGFPGSKPPSRSLSTEDPFRAPGAPAPPPIGQRLSSQPSLFGDDHEFFGPADPIGPPGPIGSRVPSGSFDPPGISAPGSSAAPGAPAGPSTGGPSPVGAGRAPSPPPPGQVLGSAALGDDDEIVQPARRSNSSGWKMSAPGAGRWSTAPPNIWQNNSWGGGPALSPVVPGVPPVGGVGSLGGMGNRFPSPSAPSVPGLPGSGLSPIGAPPGSSALSPGPQPQQQQQAQQQQPQAPEFPPGLDRRFQGFPQGSYSVFGPPGGH